MTKKPVEYACFFCGEKHEKVNEVGHIKFNDGKYERKIFVCHFCSSACLEDMLTSDYDRIAPIMGKLMFSRALDSRAL